MPNFTNCLNPLYVFHQQQLSWNNFRFFLDNLSWDKPLSFLNIHEQCARFRHRLQKLENLKSEYEYLHTFFIIFEISRKLRSLGWNLCRYYICETANEWPSANNCVTHHNSKEKCIHCQNFVCSLFISLCSSYRRQLSQAVKEVVNDNRFPNPTVFAYTDSQLMGRKLEICTYRIKCCLFWVTRFSADKLLNDQLSWQRVKWLSPNEDFWSPWTLHISTRPQLQHWRK